LTNSKSHELTIQELSQKRDHGKVERSVLKLKRVIHLFFKTC